MRALPARHRTAGELPAHRKRPRDARDHEAALIATLTTTCCPDRATHAHLREAYVAFLDGVTLHRRDKATALHHRRNILRRVQERSERDACVSDGVEARGRGGVHLSEQLGCDGRWDGEYDQSTVRPSRSLLSPVRTRQPRDVFRIPVTSVPRSIDTPRRSSRSASAMGKRPTHRDPSKTGPRRARSVLRRSYEPPSPLRSVTVPGERGGRAGTVISRLSSSARPA